MSLRRIIAIGLFAIGLLCSGVAAALLWLTAALNHDAQTIRAAVETVRAGEDIENELLEERLGQQPSSQTATAVNQRRLGMERYVTSVDEEKLLREADASMAAYFHERTPKSFTRTLTSLNRLIDLNVVEARVTAASADRARVVGNVASAVALAVMIAGVVAVLFWLRRGAVRPIEELSSAMRQYTAGDGAARARVDGPIEVADAARTFNEMADALARHRMDQLAFFGGVAHDMKNPLAALRLAIGSTSNGVDERLLQRFSLIKRQVRRLEDMIGDLLDTATLESGTLAINKVPVDLAELARESVALYAAASEDHRFEVNAPEGGVRIGCDPLRIGQVLHNLLSNAVKYSPSGTLVSLSVADGEQAVTATVSDQGAGLKADVQAHLFEPFRRGATLQPGAGLGLSVAARIARAHGGELTVQSKPGEGASFTLRLPRASPVKASHE